MKRFVFFFIFAVGISTCDIYAQTKNDDIVKLLRVSGSDKLTDHVVNAMISQFQQSIPGVQNTFWSRFRENLNVDDVLYECIPVYSNFYSHDEIKQLIKFYESPLGKKVVEVTPLLTQETMAIGQKWGEKIGQNILDELKKEGYLKTEN